MPDDELRALIRRLIEDERNVSFRRRLLHGRIDILRAELVARLKGQSSSDVDLRELTAILSGDSTRLDGTEDHLTGLLSRRAMEHALEMEVIRVQGDQSPLTVALLGIDDFKSYDGAHGHVGGDELLVRFATVLREALRPIDYAGRWDGDVFALLLPGQSETHVDALLSRLRTNLPEGPTVSIGVATWQTGECGPGLIERAELALHRSKESHRG